MLAVHYLLDDNFIYKYKIIKLTWNLTKKPLLFYSNDNFVRQVWIWLEVEFSKTQKHDKTTTHFVSKELFVFVDKKKVHIKTPNVNTF